MKNSERKTVLELLNTLISDSILRQTRAKEIQELFYHLNSQQDREEKTIGCFGEFCKCSDPKYDHYHSHPPKPTASKEHKHYFHVRNGYANCRVCGETGEVGTEEESHTPEYFQKAYDEWREQGRTEEQAYGAMNFITSGPFRKALKSLT